MTIPSLIFLPSATLLSSIKIDVTASSGICKGPVVPLELGSPAEIHIQFQEKIGLTQAKVSPDTACRCYTFFSVVWD